MICELIKKYNSSRISLIESFAQTSTIDDELPCIDDGFIEAAIDKLKDKYAIFVKEINFIQNYDKKDEVQKNKLVYLINSCQQTKSMIAFWASNNFHDIDSYIELIKNDNSIFLNCLYALQMYSNHNKKEAYKLIRSYILGGNDFANHFLLNYVFGELLLERNMLKEAEYYLLRALRLRPEELRTHKLLLELYEITSNAKGKLVEERIISMLS